jgi:hypothetical protein
MDILREIWTEPNRRIYGNRFAAINLPQRWREIDCGMTRTLHCITAMQGLRANIHEPLQAPALNFR